MLKYLMGSFSIVAIEKIILLFVAVPVNIYMARVLGPQEYGVLSLFVVVATITYQISDFGLKNVFIGIYSKKNKESLITSYFLIKFLWSLCLLIAIAVYYVFFGEEKYYNYYLMISIGLMFTFSDVFETIALSELRQSTAAKARLIAGLIVNALRFFLIYIGVHTSWLILSFGIEFLIKGIVLYNKKTVGEIKFDLKLVRELVTRSYPLLLSIVFLQLYIKSNIFIINDLLGESALGIYSVAMKLIDYLTFGALILNTVMNPMISKLNNSVVVKDVYQKYYFIVFWGAVIVSIIFYMLSDIIITYLYGVEYLKSAIIFSMMTISIPFMYLGSISGFWYVSNKLEKYALFRNISGLVLNILLSYILVPIYGIIGVTYSLLISYVFTALVVDVLFLKTRAGFMLKISGIFLFFKYINKGIK